MNLGPIMRDWRKKVRNIITWTFVERYSFLECLLFVQIIFYMSNLVYQILVLLGGLVFLALFNTTDRIRFADFMYHCDRLNRYLRQKNSTDKSTVVPRAPPPHNGA